MSEPQDKEIDFIRSFIAAQRQFKTVLKNKTNPAFKSKYADLSSIHDAVIGALNTNGICLSGSTEYNPDKDVTVAVVELIHEGGFIKRATFPIRDETALQKAGSAMTYIRRYCESIMMGVVADDDDDGEASKAIAKQKQEELGQLCKEYAEAVSVAPDIATLEKYMLDNVKTMDRLLKEKPAWHKALCDKVAARRAELNNPQQQAEG